MPAPSRALLGAAALTIIALPHWAYAAEPQSPATASFALIPEPAPTAETFPAPPPTPAQAPAPVVDRGEPTNPGKGCQLLAPGRWMPKDCRSSVTAR